MDQFYQVLRKVQKKERNNGTLARVEETFYNDMHEYMNELKQQAISDPFSKAPALLKEAQIIATEICQRRETKIANSAVLNIHRSYHLFTGKPQFDLVDTTPLNLTPEEETFYYSLIDTLKNHRVNISLEELSEEESNEKTTIIKPIETQVNTLTSSGDDVENNSGKLPANEKPKEIIKPKSIVNEVQTDNKPKNNMNIIKDSVDVEENPNAFNPQDEFYDFESKKVARETELVTMLVFDEVGAIVGVDEKVYGPFRPQDIVTLPLINAKIFFKNRKGRQVKI